MSRFSRAELEALAAEGNAVAVDASSAIAWAARTFGRSIIVAESMANGALSHLVAAQAPGVDVLFLDTDYHFPETIATRDDVATRVNVQIIDVRPLQTIEEQAAQYGPDLFARDPNQCCALRKVEPLNRALAGYDAWVTGVRRVDAPTRANTQLVEVDERRGMVKVNPLAAWTDDELMTYIITNDVPVNPLTYQGYPSIGCAPCTAPVIDGEDPRSGRWRGQGKTECGLHI